MHGNLSEEKIIKGCIEGNRYAQKELYDKYRSIMFAICMRYARNKDEAEDVLIDGFMKIFSKIKDFRGEGSFEGWLKRIMINTAINCYRLNLKYNNSISIDNSAFDIKDEADIFKKTYSADYLTKLIQELPDGYRVVFNMYEIEGYSHKEIAKELNISVSTAKTQLFHAKKSLKNSLLKIKKEEFF